VSALSEFTYVISAIIVTSVDIHTHIFDPLLKIYHNIFIIEPAYQGEIALWRQKWVTLHAERPEDDILPQTVATGTGLAASDESAYP